MFQGIVDHRISPRAPFKTEIVIDFIDEKAKSVTAKTVDISAGGIQFWVPLEKNCFTDGDHIKLLFDLPFYGKTNVQAEIKHSRYGIDIDQTRIIYFGAKFLSITMEIWNAIMDYSRTTIESTPEIANTYHHQRNDIRIKAGVTSKLYLEENQPHICQIEDISFGGAKLRLPISVQANTPIKLVILDPEQPFSLEGICVWGEASENEQDFFIGIFFNQLDNEKYDQLRSYIFKLAT